MENLIITVEGVGITVEEDVDEEEIIFLQEKLFLNTLIDKEAKNTKRELPKREKTFAIDVV